MKLIKLNSRFARLWTSGFELNSATSGVEWTTVTNGTISSTTTRSGGFAGRVTSFVSGTARGFNYQFLSATGKGPYFVRFYFNYATLPGVNTNIFAYDNNTTVQSASSLSITLTTTGTLKLVNGATQIGSDSSALSANTWYRIEVKYDASAGLSSGVTEALLDGVSFASGSGLVLAPSSVLSIDLGGNLNIESNTAGDWFFDDVAINDSTGTAQTSYPGSGKVIHLRPAGAGDNATWTPTSGTNWSNTSEVTPDDGTTTVRAATAVHLDDYAIDTPTGDLVGATINCLQVGVRFNGNNATQANNPTFKVRFKATASGTVTESTGINPNATAYQTNALANPRNHPLTLYTNPDSTTITSTTLGTSQVGVDLSTTGNGSAVDNVSTLWVAVDYVPSTSTTNTSQFMPFFYP